MHFIVFYYIASHSIYCDRIVLYNYIYIYNIYIDFEIPSLYLHMYALSKVVCFLLSARFFREEGSFSHYYICLIICMSLVLKVMLQMLKLNLPKNAI